MSLTLNNFIKMKPRNKTLIPNLINEGRYAFKGTSKALKTYKKISPSTSAGSYEINGPITNPILENY